MGKERNINLSRDEQGGNFSITRDGNPLFEVNLSREGGQTRLTVTSVKPDGTEGESVEVTTPEGEAGAEGGNTAQQLPAQGGEQAQTRPAQGGSQQ